MKKQKIKKFYEARFQRELKELEPVIQMAVEYSDLLEQLEVKSIGEFELKINQKSGFVNALMSATAYGKDKEYGRLLQLEKAIDGRITKDDLTSNKDLKKPFIDAIKEKHTEYYTDEDIKTKNTLEKIIETYNALDLDQRKHIGFSREGKLMFSPFSTLLR
jgi:hypothetical protein